MQRNYRLFTAAELSAADYEGLRIVMNARGKLETKIAQAREEQRRQRVEQPFKVFLRIQLDPNGEYL